MKKLLAYSLLAGFAACVGWQVWIHIDYAATMPAAPEPTSGRIYRLVVNHGTVVYVNKQEFTRAEFAFNELYFVELFVFSAFLVLQQYKKI
jgi:hypothetical protein